MVAVPASAEEMQIYEGEPTDPEGVLHIIQTFEVDLDDHGLAAPSDEDDEDWFEALVELLRDLGLLPQEARSS
ncbi:MAG: hypothetical protein HKN12_10465 [Gemmatimonadetes bacterium]|nr:hypothetical protein [Gemmatimonadota bacterium]